MNFVLETTAVESNNRIKSFQASADLFSKQCAALLGFVVPISTFATHVVLFFLVASWFLAGSLKEKTKIILNHPVARITMVFFGVFIIGTLYSTVSYIDSLSMLGKMDKLLYIPFLLPIMTEEKWRRLGFMAFLSAMVLTLILSLLKVYAGLPIAQHMQFSAVFKDDIFTNLMMAFASFMTGHYILTQINFLKKAALIFLYLGLVFYILVISPGRSGQVVFLALTLLLGLQRLRLKGLLMSVACAVVFVCIAYSTSSRFDKRVLLVVQNIEQYFAGNANTSVGARLEFLMHSWQLAKQHIWFGHGTGSFSEIYQKYAIDNQLQITQNPHNEYLNILFQLGLVGLAVFLVFFFCLFKLSFKLPNPEKCFAQGITLAIITGCFANSWLMDFTSGYFFVIIIAFCFGALNCKKGSLV